MSDGPDLFTRLPHHLEPLACAAQIVPLINAEDGIHMAKADLQWLTDLGQWLQNGSAGQRPGVVLDYHRQSTLVDLQDSHAGLSTLSPSARARLRNLISIDGSKAAADEREFFVLGNATFRGTARNEPMDDQHAMAAPFAKTAQYMGSKRRLGGLLIEAVDSVAKPESVILDLMTGSGSAAGWFAHHWPTIASDSEQFASLLATVHGAGYDEARARNLARRVIEDAEVHYARVAPRYQLHLREEQRWLLAEPSQETLDGYRHFLEARTMDAPWPGRPQFDPRLWREEGRNGMLQEENSLFMATYANVYFGIRQCLEIDSLHWAIERLSDSTERSWATGAAMTTISYAGTKYAGHFAQPRKLTRSSLELFQQHRSIPIFLEFMARLSALGKRSQDVSFPVKAVPGPWQEALAATEQANRDAHVVVYLDAPYKREEYNRYYHPLETFIRYDYPKTVGKGLVPSKADGYRFASEFFTTNAGVMAERLAAVIVECLKRDWPVVWSYASTGMADPRHVIEAAAGKVPLSLHGYGIPYSHRSQGRRKARQLQEYVFVMDPE